MRLTASVTWRSGRPRLRCNNSSVTPSSTMKTAAATNRMLIFSAHTAAWAASAFQAIASTPITGPSGPASTGSATKSPPLALIRVPSARAFDASSATPSRSAASSPATAMRSPSASSTSVARPFAPAAVIAAETSSSTFGKALNRIGLLSALALSSTVRAAWSTTPLTARSLTSRMDCTDSTPATTIVVTAMMPAHLMNTECSPAPDLVFPPSFVMLWSLASHWLCLRRGLTSALRRRHPRSLRRWARRCPGR